MVPSFLPDGRSHSNRRNPGIPSSIIENHLSNLLLDDIPIFESAVAPTRIVLVIGLLFSGLFLSL